MFAKKKIVLNSAQSNNKHGVAEITRLDNLTQLSIKLNNFRPNLDSNYIFLLKNNDLQQKIALTNPCDFSCDVSIPIDLDKKISCLLIESGEKQIPLFWGGTETQMQVMSILEETARQKLRLDGQTLTHAQTQSVASESNAYKNDENIIKANNDLPPTNNQSFASASILHNSTTLETASDTAHSALTQNEWQTATATSATVLYSQNQQYNFLQNQCDNLCDNCPNFEQSDIEKVIDDEIVKYELIENFDEPDSPQCQNCKYKNVFYQEKYLDQAKEQLTKIAQMQANEQNVQYTAQNMQDNCYILQDNSQNDDFDINNDETNKIENKNNLTSADPYYYGLIKAQYDDMFSKYPVFSPLTNIIENSKWIAVESVDDPYIMGIIYDDDKPKYLCYGIVQEKKQSPPIEIADSSQWVPFDISNEFGSGVWIMYQSADNGETIKVEVI